MEGEATKVDTSCLGTATHLLEKLSSRWSTSLNTSLLAFGETCRGMTEFNNALDEHTYKREGRDWSIQYLLDDSIVKVDISNNWQWFARRYYRSSEVIKINWWFETFCRIIVELLYRQCHNCHIKLYNMNLFATTLNYRCHVSWLVWNDLKLLSSWVTVGTERIWASAAVRHDWVKTTLKYFCCAPW